MSKNLATGSYRKTEIGKIPKDWEVKKIGEVAKLNLESLSGNTSEDYEFYYYDLSAIDKGKITHPTDKIAFKNAPSRARRLFKRNDILMSTVRPYLQDFSYVDFDAKDCVCSTGFAVITANHEADSKFLYYNLFSYGVTNQINRLLVGSNYPAINTKDVENLKIPYPQNMEERKKIGAILSTWDKAIKLKEKLIEQKKLQKKGLMQKLLNGEVRPFGSNSKVTKVRLKGLIKEIKLRNKNNKITRILSVTNSKGFIEQSEQFDRQVASKDLSNYKVVKYGQFAYNPSRVNVGSIDLLTKFEEGVLSPMYVVFTTVKEKLLPEYLYQFLKSKEFFNQIKSLLQGSVRQNLSFDALELIKLYVPNDLNEQKEIVKILSTADTEIALLEQELEALKQQKKGLMQLLLTGKVRVKV